MLNREFKRINENTTRILIVEYMQIMNSSPYSVLLGETRQGKNPLRSSEQSFILFLNSSLICYVQTAVSSLSSPKTSNPHSPLPMAHFLFPYSSPQKRAGLQHTITKHGRQSNSSHQGWTRPLRRRKQVPLAVKDCLCSHNQESHKNAKLLSHRIHQSMCLCYLCY